MKLSRLSICFLVITFLFSVLGFEKVASAEDYPPVTVKIDDKLLPGQNGIVDGGSVFVAAKAFFENLDIKVEWDQSTSTLKGYQFDAIRIEISPNKDVGKLDGKPFLMDSPPKVVDGTLMVPSSVITQLFNYEVKYEPIANMVKIDKGQLIAVDPYASYNKKLEIETKNNIQENRTNEIFKPYMGKTVWYINGILKDINNKPVYNVQNLTPMWILKVTKWEKVPNFFTLTLKSGEHVYLLDILGEYDVSSKLLKENPFEKYKWSKKTWDYIKNRTVYIGMNKDMVLLAKSAPERTNITKYSWGVFEQWVYDYPLGAEYLYFKNGLLSGIQET